MNKPIFFLEIKKFCLKSIWFIQIINNNKDKLIRFFLILVSGIDLSIALEFF